MIDVKDLHYRGKRVKNNNWEYGCYVKLESKDKDGEFEHFIIEPQRLGGQFEVFGETVGLGTTLKDTHNWEIFTGDIIYFQSNYKEYVGVVFFGGSYIPGDETMKRFVIYNDDKKESINDDWFYDLDSTHSTVKDVEIIGNIYDNKDALELLRKQNKTQKDIKEILEKLNKESKNDLS